MRNPAWLLGRPPITLLGFAAWLLACESRDVDESRAGVLGAQAVHVPSAVTPHVVGGSELSQSEPTQTHKKIEAQRLPLFSPTLDEQLLSCDQRGFVQLTHDGIAAYENQRFRRIMTQGIPEALGVIALGGSSHLILSRDRVHRYYHGQAQTRSFAKVPVLGPTEIFADSSDVNHFTLRYARDDALHVYDLVPREDEHVDEALGLVARESRLRLGEAHELPSFDRRLVIRLRDGSWLYTSKEGLLRKESSGVSEVPAPKVRGKLALLKADDRLDRYWALSDEGEAALMELSKGAPIVKRIALGGLPYAAEQRADVLAVLVVVQDERQTQWLLKVYAGEKELAVFPLPNRPGDWGTEGQLAPANRDLCLFPHAPWVLVGGRDGVRIFDFRKRRQIFPEVGSPDLE